MTKDQQRKILEAAAKSCGIKGYFVNNELGIKHEIGEPGKFKPAYFNPITNSADTASMCAKLEIEVSYLDGNELVCEPAMFRIREYVKHNGTPEGKESAWRLAASMVAAKVGGYSE